MQLSQVTYIGFLTYLTLVRLYSEFNHSVFLNLTNLQPYGKGPVLITGTKQQSFCFDSEFRLYAEPVN